MNIPGPKSDIIPLFFPQTTLVSAEVFLLSTPKQEVKAELRLFLGCSAHDTFLSTSQRKSDLDIQNTYNDIPTRN